MNILNPLNEKPTSLQAFAAIAWLCFLSSGVATGIVFSLFDPESMRSCVSFLENSHRLEAYSIGFFFFWLLTSASCLVSYFFLQTE